MTQKRGTPIVAIATSGVVYEKMISNMNEVKARGGRVVAVIGENNPDLRHGQLWHNEEVLADCAIPVPELTESFAPFMQALALQLLAYHIARMRGEDVDKPRNLAKSVTVE